MPSPTPRPILAISRRTRSTPFTPRVEASGVQGYTVYNHMLLPTAFRSVEADYQHLKTHVQVWDVGCERQVEVKGPDAARLVQMMTPRDLSKAKIGQCLYAPLVDADGMLLNDPVILKLAEDRFWISVADSDVLLWTKGLAFGRGLDVVVSEPDVWPLAIQGPKAEVLASRIFGEEVRGIGFFRFRTLTFHGHPLIVARSGWSKQGGFEIYLDRADLGLPLWDACMTAGADLDVGPGCPNLIERIESGLLSYGNDMTIANNPLECGLDKYCQLDSATSCIGRDALRRIAAEGAARKIMGLRLEGGAPPACVAPWPVRVEDKKVGIVTSAAYSPDFGASLAFAMLERGHWEPGGVVVVETPAGLRRGVISPLPFARS
ncbi:dimethylsulfoniopropionate demethylase [Dongia rigui]|uniref:Dimethylsulfoniopropionate demethylase n=1 Tax=Dongia rigui TaxID=940149 RepID=A0ABU5DXD4_9PROT|nr:dimethylsulfoniopropionate demethylase [Dongia rigui]MDY0871971.1 dimethylsulfoniopropionate demethylase [Dongia rigui]